MWQRTPRTVSEMSRPTRYQSQWIAARSACSGVMHRLYSFKLFWKSRIRPMPSAKDGLAKRTIEKSLTFPLLCVPLLPPEIPQPPWPFLDLSVARLLLAHPNTLQALMSRGNWRPGFRQEELGIEVHNQSYRHQRGLARGKLGHNLIPVALRTEMSYRYPDRPPVWPEERHRTRAGVLLLVA